MNILVLIANGARHHHFALTIMEAFPNDNVSIAIEPKGHRPRRPTARDRLLSHRFLKLRNRALNRVFAGDRRRFSSERTETNARYFAEATPRFEELGKDRIIATTRKGESINDTQYVKCMARSEPDVIVVMGTGLVSRKIIELPRLAAINQHGGLSPYYRGGATNMWPIINGEPQYCGVTVHHLTTGVDAGPILYHGLPVIEPDDTTHSINCKSLLIGARLVVKAIRDAIEGRAAGVPQWRKGRQYNNQDLNAWQYHRYHRALDSGVIRDYPQRLNNGRIRLPDRMLLAPELNVEQYVPNEAITNEP